MSSGINGIWHLVTFAASYPETGEEINGNTLRPGLPFGVSILNDQSASLNLPHDLCVVAIGLVKGN
jgi:hypothetical protein